MYWKKSEDMTRNHDSMIMSLWLANSILHVNYKTSRSFLTLKWKCLNELDIIIIVPLMLKKCTQFYSTSWLVTKLWHELSTVWNKSVASTTTPWSLRLVYVEIRNKRTFAINSNARHTFDSLPSCLCWNCPSARWLQTPGKHLYE